MWECYINNVHLLFLPPHTSHVLQPLDMAVFGPIKTHYRKELSKEDIVDNSTIVGKRYFLACYIIARLLGLTRDNIRTTPSNDTTNAGQTTANTTKVVDWTSAASVVDWSTPRKASDLCGQLKLFTELRPDHHTQRLLFRKVKKAFSEKSFLLASSQQQVRVLEARVKRIAPRKKKSVQTDPNTKFANIRDIKTAQEDAGERLISPSRTAEVELPSEGSDCIVVAVEGS
ncbi:transposase [Colletotrichum abscissum]|uniref:transposase n=1 Tax=Colletotrichum abscissum TaxID=1671311 RepID=UPI0027D5EF1D|nr:transposase [Colletotrichum abscissum]KAK1510587.1 transposase [Colletotrichum abscissum]